MGQARGACAHGFDFRLARNRAYASTLCTSNILVVGGALNRSPTSSIILGLNSSEAASASSFVSQRLNDPNSFASSSPMKTIDLNPLRALYAAEADARALVPFIQHPRLEMHQIDARIHGCFLLLLGFLSETCISVPDWKINPTGQSRSLRAAVGTATSRLTGMTNHIRSVE